jgi:hypothetical protein
MAIDTCFYTTTTKTPLAAIQSVIDRINPAINPQTLFGKNMFAFN